MAEGDEWKHQDGMSNWNAPLEIARDEYGSIMEAFYEHVLRGVVQQGQRLDKTAVSMTKSDLEFKIENPEFQKLPIPVRNAYQEFRKLTVALEEASDEEIASLRAPLEGLFLLGINCETYGHELSKSSGGIYFGRNPCRNDQYKMYSALKEAEVKLSDSKVLDALKGMFDVCRHCPYK